MSSVGDVLDALEDVDWRSVDGISVDEVAAFVSRLQEAQEENEREEQ